LEQIQIEQIRAWLWRACNADARLNCHGDWKSAERIHFLKA